MNNDKGKCMHKSLLIAILTIPYLGIGQVPTVPSMRSTTQADTSISTYSVDTRTNNIGQTVSAAYTNGYGYLQATADPVPEGVKQLPGYSPGVMWMQRIVGGTTNYSLVKTVATGFTRPPDEEPERTMVFKMTLYDDLTKDPMGEMVAEVNWDRSFAKMETTVTNGTVTGTSTPGTMVDPVDDPDEPPTTTPNL